MAGRFDRLFVEIEFASGDWTDVTSYVNLVDGTLEWSRGRANAYEQSSTGALSMLLDNVDGRFTPNSAVLTTGSANPYYPNVLENKRVRVRAEHGNLCLNPSFETDTAYWGNAYSYAVASFATSTAYASEAAWGLLGTWGDPVTWAPGIGAHSMLVTWPTIGAGGSAAQYGATGLTIGQQYTFSGWVLVPSAGTPPRVAIAELFGTATGITYGVQDTGSTVDAFVRLDMTFTATATTHYLGFVNDEAATAGETCYIDAVQLEAGATLREYVETGGIFDLWLGFIDSLSSSFPGGEAKWAKVAVNASDRFKLLSRRQLSTVYEETARYAGADAYYPLAVDNESTTGLEVTDRIRPDGSGLIVPPAFNANALQTWDNSEKPLQLAGALAFSGYAASPSLGGGAGVVTVPPLALGSGDFTLTVGFWFKTSVGVYHVMFMGTDHLAFFDVDGSGIFGANLGNAHVYSTETVDDGRWHHALGVFSLTGSTYDVSAWLDGNLLGTDSDTSTDPLTLTNWVLNGTVYDTTPVRIVPPEKAGNSNDVAYAGLFLADSDLSAYSADFYDAGHNNLTGDTSAARAARILGWSGLLSSEYDIDTDTDAVIGSQDTVGKSALDALQEIARAEYAPLLVRGDGDVVQQSRARRATLTPEVSFSADTAIDGPALILDLADEGVANIVVGQVTGGANVSVYVSDTFVDSYIDSYSNAVLNPVQDTVEAPWSTLAQARDAAYRRLLERYQARLRMSPVVITPLTASGDIWVDCFTLDVSMLFRVTDLYAATSGGTTYRDLFAEGFRWSGSEDSWTLTVDTTAMDRAFGQIEFDDDVTGRFGHGAGLMTVDTVSALAGTGTGTFTIETSSGPLWSVDAADYPLTVKIDEEEMTISAMSGGTSPQTATISARGANGTSAAAHAAGALVELWSVPSMAH